MPLPDKFKVERAKRTASDYIRLYFRNKKLYSGGDIPKSVIEDKKYISIVLNTVISHGIYKAHKMMGEVNNNQLRMIQRNGELLPSTETIIQVLDLCSKLNIPKRFAAGILLIHLELCEGWIMIWDDLTVEMIEKEKGDAG